MQGQRRALMTDYHRPVDAPDRAPGRLQDDSGPLQRLDEAAGGAGPSRGPPAPPLREEVIDAPTPPGSGHKLDPGGGGGGRAPRGGAPRGGAPPPAGPG